MKMLAGLGILLALFAALLPVSNVPTTFAAKNCSDFTSQAAAQAYMSDSPGDPDRLDGNNNGVSCEELPCPCDTVPVDWWKAGTPSAGASTSSANQQATATATPGPASSASTTTGQQSSGPKQVVVSQGVYNAVVAAIREGRDPVLVYNELSRLQTAAPPTCSITPPNTGDAGLATRR